VSLAYSFTLKMEAASCPEYFNFNLLVSQNEERIYGGGKECSGQHDTVVPPPELVILMVLCNVFCNIHFCGQSGKERILFRNCVLNLT
jgi:hypothetical protein